MKLVADRLIADCVNNTYDLIALPGGMPGAEQLAAHEGLMTLARAQRDANRILAAICAAPAVTLSPHGLIRGARATCYPSFADRMVDGQWQDKPVVKDGTLVTSQGPATAIAFSLTLVTLLTDQPTAETIARQLLV